MSMSNRALPVIRVSPARISRARLRLPPSFRRDRSYSAPRSVEFRIEIGRIPARDRFIPTERGRGEYPCHRGLSTRIRLRTISARVRQNDIGIGRRRAPPHDPQNSNAHPTAAPARCGQCHSDGHPGRQSGPVPRRRAPCRSHAGRGPPVSGRAATILRTSVTILPERTSFEVERTTV